MTTYLLFLNGFFKNRKDVEEFSNDFIENVSNTNSLKVFIENKESIILIFDSDEEVEILRNNINNFLNKNPGFLAGVFCFRYAVFPVIY